MFLFFFEYVFKGLCIIHLAHKRPLMGSRDSPTGSKLNFESQCLLCFSYDYTMSC